jgi:hypothetical protein
MSYKGFEFERDLHGVKVHVTILEWQDAEPDVGIMSGGPTLLKVVNADTGADISETIGDDAYDYLCSKGAELAEDAARGYDDDEHLTDPPCL